MKTKLIILISFYFATNLYSQEGQKDCFEIDYISNYEIKPSKKGKLTYQISDELIFRLDENRKGVVLKSRIKNSYIQETDSLNETIKIVTDNYAEKHNIFLLGNYSDTTINIPTTYGIITMIQEAKDENGIWRPIELNKNYVWCGTGAFYTITLEPMEYIEIYTRKYCGDIKTKLRVKMNTNFGIIYSEEFEGYIYKNQYNLKTLLKYDNLSHYNFIDIEIPEEVDRMKKNRKKMD